MPPRILATKKNPVLAAGFSLVPGLGQFYLGDVAKGLALLFVDVGIILGVVFFHYRVARLLALMIYVVTATQAGLECYFIAKTGKNYFSLDSKIYVVAMLLLTGFTALPLLWQDGRFSRTTKILWTIAVPLLAILFFSSFVLWAPGLEKTLARWGFL